MPPHGPCGNPGCDKPDHSGGQWRELKEENVAGRTVRESAEYACKRQAGSEAGDVPVCVPVKVEKQDSRPYGLLEINDIWGIRSARARTPH